MNFSVVIPTKDRPRLVLRLLRNIESCAKTFSGKIEVICVDNGSQTTSKKKVFGFFTKEYLYIPLAEQKLGPSFARNKGAAHASYKHIIFLDDDCEIDKAYFLLFQSAWQKHPNARMIGGNVGVKLDGSNFSARERKVISKHDWCFGKLNKDKSRMLVPGELLHAANMSIRIEKKGKKVFDEQLGKVLPNGQILYAEDFELSNRYMLLGDEVFYDKSIEVQNVVSRKRFSSRYLAQRYWNAGKERFIVDQTLKKYDCKSYTREILEALSLRLLFTGRSHFQFIFKNEYSLLVFINYYACAFRALFR
ncbi:MAG: glycosyltransferase family A protein [bacterium]|nr:glycosyltransferase family A protein [bacterium]